MKWIIEYSEEQEWCHLNSWDEQKDTFDKPLFANNYKPISLVDDGTVNANLLEFLDSLSQIGLSFEEVAYKVLTYLVKYDRRGTETA